MKHITQLVAHVPPEADGVGHYAWGLARRMRADFGIETHFLVGGGAAAEAGTASEFRCTRLREHTREALACELRRTAQRVPLVLHYVGYGYANNGAPRWLAGGLEDWLKLGAPAQPVVIFHELYATSMPWRKAFWHSPSQRAIARQLRALAAESLCTIERNEELLREWAPAKRVARLAIPSTIGEPVEPLPPWAQRRAVLVIFGRSRLRELAYRSANELRSICERIGAEEIWDIGPGLARPPPAIGTRIVEHGRLPAEQVGRMLAACRFGHVHYSTEHLAKSSVFAAYCAYGMATILPSACVGRQTDGLARGRHYLAPEDLGAASEADVAAVASSSASWYRPHDERAHARWLAEACSAMA